MSTFLIAVALCIGSDEGAPRERAFHDIERDIGASLKQEAKAKKFDEKAAAVHKLAILHNEVRRDARRETSDTLAAYQTRLRTRLLKVKKEMIRETAREQAAGAKSEEPKAQSDAGLLENASAAPAPSQSISAALAMQLDWFASSQGGAARLVSDGAQSQADAAGRGGGAVPDNSAALIDLIERTISPDHWDTNGGPGAIVYYQPLHVLVIRASGEVHGRVGGLVGGLRAAGP